MDDVMFSKKSGDEAAIPLPEAFLTCRCASPFFTRGDPPKSASSAFDGLGCACAGQ
jgi:hypothetical protein